MKRKNKDKDEDLTVAENGWGMLDNLGDKIIEDVVTGFTSDLLTSVPMGGIVVGLYKGFRRANEQKKYKNFIAFIQSYKTNSDKEISEYIKENPTSELGDYTLDMLQELSSVRQTEMLGRATALLLNGVIKEDVFFEYGYIISKLDPHLFSVVVNLHNRCFIDERGREDLKKKIELAMDLKRGSSITNPNQDLVSFGFLNPIEINIGGAGMDKLPQQQYTVSPKYKKFYDIIIIGEKCTQ